MKRAPIVLSATVAGLAVTLGFHAQTPSTTALATSTAQTPAATTPASTATATTAATTAAATSQSTSASTTTTVTGDAAANQYGNVQLKVTIAGGKITAVQAVQLPSNDGKSVEINAYAEPILQASALKAQSAQIDAVSGATYTSDSYKTALQSALDKANFTASGATS